MSRRYRKRHASPAAVAPFTPCAEPTTQRTGEAWRNLPRHAAIPARPPRAVGGRRPTIIAIGNRLARQPPAARLCQYRAPAPSECRRPTPNRLGAPRGAGASHPLAPQRSRRRSHAAPARDRDAPALGSPKLTPTPTPGAVWAAAHAGIGKLNTLSRGEPH